MRAAVGSLDCGGYLGLQIWGLLFGKSREVGLGRFRLRQKLPRLFLPLYRLLAKYVDIGRGARSLLMYIVRVVGRLVGGANSNNVLGEGCALRFFVVGE